MSTLRLQANHISDGRYGGRGFRMPSTAKFQSGHLPSTAVPVSRTLPMSVNDDGSGSDMDISLDSDDEVYSGRYSLESSPQDVKHVNGARPRYVTPLDRDVNCGLSDFSVTKESVMPRGHVVMRLGGEGGGHPVGKHDYTDDESTDSAASLGVPLAQGKKNSGDVVQRGSYPVGSYHSHVSQATAEIAVKQDINGGGLRNMKPSNDDLPTAPPFVGAYQEINQEAGHVPTLKEHRMPGSINSTGSAVKHNQKTTTRSSGVNAQDGTRNGISDPSERMPPGVDAAISPSLPARLPTFHASGLGPWCAVISYDACVRLCLHSWAQGCTEAPIFLDNECALLRNAFGLQQVLLQSEEELLAHRSSELASEGAAPKTKKTTGKMKVQVRRVKMDLDPPTGCSFTSLKPSKQKMESLRFRASSFKSTLSSGWDALRNVRVTPHIPANGSFSRQSLAYVHAGTQYIKEVSGLLKTGMTTLRNGSSSYEAVPETYSCFLRLKSSSEEDVFRMQPGSGETHVFLPDSLGDDLIIEVKDSKGKHVGQVLAQVAVIADDPGDKLRWWSIFSEPEHELVGRIQLYINYSTSPDENSHLKCGSVAETVAYDLVLEVAMKVQHFQQRNLLLSDPWKWLLMEFASYYGVSDAYTKLRYLSYVMDVATPTADCLDLIHDLLLPVLMKGKSKSTLSHQENRILGEVVDQVEQTLALVFENYKSLDESLPSGMVDIFRPATGFAAPALASSIKLYTLIHDILSPEAQLKLCRHFQAAAKKRSRRLVAETDEFVSNNNENILVDSVTLSTAYQKMNSLCSNIRSEIFTDIEIHKQHILPSFIDLPNLSSSIYSVELCSRMRAFLVACPPTEPSRPVAELVIAIADFQRDLANWNINPIKGGVDAKELFHSYISLWIQDKRLALLESCKLDKVKWSGVRTQHSTTPFVDDMYDRLKETLNEYEVIISRWPEYTFPLENALADVEKAILDALDRQYADVLSPLKDNLTNKIFGLKYVQKIAKGTTCTYAVPDELGVLLNSLKRMLDVLRPKIESKLKSWGSCIPDDGNAVPGERLSEITVMLRAKLRNYLQAVVDKLAENTRVQGATNLRKIIKDSRETVVESDVRSRMQFLKDLLTKTMDHLHSVFETHVFIAVCRGLWDRMGQDVLSFLENRKENRAWYKGSRIAVSVLDDICASQMQQLLGNALQPKDLEPPRSIMEVHSVLCKDAVNHEDKNYYY